MKKLIVIFLSLVCVLSLFACSGERDNALSADTESTEEYSVLSTDEETREEKPAAVKLALDMLPRFEVARDIPTNSQNPWNADLKLDTMPLMKKGDKLLTTLDATRKANEIALSLGLAIGAASVNESADGGFWLGLACSEGLQTVTISVNESGEVYIIYQNGGKKIPDEYKGDKLSWLTDTYAPLFFEGETLSYGNGSFGAIYKKGANGKENLINYFFNNVNFAEDYNLDTVSMELSPTGTLQRVSAKCSDYYTAVEYPIISLDEAEEMLSRGKCYCSVAENDFTGVDRKKVVSATLTYGTDSVADVFIPSYCFWVEAEREGKPCYVPYSVPAIAPEYLDVSGIDFLMEANR